MTTINQNGVKIGKAATKILISRLEGRRTDFVKKVVPASIVQRGSAKKMG